jgi:cysteine-rich repeat protein/YVTN family beta-propeller protein
MTMGRRLVAAALAGAITLAARDVAAAASAYVANSTDATVSVVDTATNAVVATIPVDSGGPVDIAVNPAGNRVYVATVVSGAVTVIDATTNTVADAIDLGANPVVMAIHPDGSRVYVTVARVAGDALLAVDPATRMIVGDVAIAQESSAIAIDPLGARVYVADFSAGSIAVRDATTLAALTPLGTGPLPFALAVHPSGSPLFSGHQDAVALIDPGTGGSLGTIPVCCTTALAVNPAGTRLYAGTGAVVVADTASKQVVTTVTLPPPAADIPVDVAVDASGTRVYATGSDVDSDAPASLWVIDATTNTYVGAVTVGVGATAVAVGPESTCGNGVVEATEQCDDGNDVGGDGCEPSCTFLPTTTTTVSGPTTTTTLFPRCATIPDCQQVIDGMLPDVAAASDRRERKGIKRLHRLDRKADGALAAAEGQTGRRQARRLAIAARTLRRLLAVGTRLAERDSSLVPLPSLQVAVNALIALTGAPPA